MPQKNGENKFCLKSVLNTLDLFSNKKMGVNFFTGKMTFPKVDKEEERGEEKTKNLGLIFTRALL